MIPISIWIKTSSRGGGWRWRFCFHFRLSRLRFAVALLRCRVAVGGAAPLIPPKTTRGWAPGGPETPSGPFQSHSPDCLAILLPFSFATFFRCIFGPMFNRFPKLGTKHRPKKIKNRCQAPLHHGLHFLFDSWSTFAPNYDLKERRFSFGKHFFLQKRLSMLPSIFYPVLVPDLPHFEPKVI